MSGPWVAANAIGSTRKTTNASRPANQRPKITSNPVGNESSSSWNFIRFEREELIAARKRLTSDISPMAVRPKVVSSSPCAERLSWPRNIKTSAAHKTCSERYIQFPASRRNSVRKAVHKRLRVKLPIVDLFLDQGRLDDSHITVFQARFDGLCAIERGVDCQ